MKTERVRVAVILAAFLSAATYLLFQLTQRLAVQSITDSIDDPALRDATIDRLHGQFSLYALIMMIAALGVGWLLARKLMKPFQRVTALMASGRDVTEGSRIAEVHDLEQAAERRDRERRVRTDELEGSMSRLTQLVSEVSDGLVLVDDNGRVLQSNPAAIRLLALPQEPARQNIVTLIRNVDIRQIVKRALLGETIDAAEITVDARHLLINAHPVADALERRAGAAPDQRSSVVITVVDLTDLRRLESVRRDFVANVSHELKTPLTSIHGYTETLLADHDMPAEMRRQFLEVIDRNALRLQRIVDELLDLSRIESGAWQPEIDVVDAAQVARDVWSSCRELSHAREITFASPEQPVLVRADGEGLHHVLSNVIGNAVRYTPAGGAITVSARDAGDMRIVEVTDTGAGIPREAIRRIFERFYRVDPARSREAGGTGLGLAIVKHLVEGMNGSVSAASELGKGTTISITLPAA